MKILTLNIWGAPYAKHRSARIVKICEEIKRLDPDILLFQEAYLEGNRQELIAGLVDVWRHHHYFPSAIIGSGLLTMSKYPIVDAVFYKFRMQGKPEDLMRGDYYAGKGIGLTRIDTPDGTIDVYNCHPHAQYEPDNDNEYAAYTETSLYEAARFIDSQSGASPVVLCGDLNTRPDQAGYCIITQLGSLVDTDLHINQSHEITFSADNPYSESDNQCLDYIFARNLGVDSIELVMNERLLGSEALAYSDHYGLLAEISINGDKLNQYDAEIAPVMEALYQRVSDELLDTESQQMKHLERAVFGLASVLDGMMFGAFIGRFSKRLARLVRRIGFFTTIGYALWQVIQAGVNLQSRKNTLLGIQQELKTQIEAKRLFDGHEF